MFVLIAAVHWQNFMGLNNAQSLFQSLISLLTSLNGQQILEYNPQSNLEFKEKLLTVMVQQFKLYKVTVTNDSLLICQRLLQSDYLRFKDMIADVQQDNSTSVNTADQLEDDEWDMIKAADIETAD
ncbi:hypothetical protein MIR68_006836 [Amoeboaphelidium protococcarum]|nr:hypothetical protein MIR68_006836 [Amoeboaphelidium protococcarum]